MKNRFGVDLPGDEWWHRLMAATGARAKERSGSRANDREGMVERAGVRATVGTRGFAAERLRRASAEDGRAERACARVVETSESKNDSTGSAAASRASGFAVACGAPTRGSAAEHGNARGQPTIGRARGRGLADTQANVRGMRRCGQSRQFEPAKCADGARTRGRAPGRAILKIS